MQMFSANDMMAAKKKKIKIAELLISSILSFVSLNVFVHKLMFIGVFRFK